LFRSGRFDADEHPAEVGVAKQLQQVLVLSHVERGFGAEAESVIVLVLIFLEEGEKLLSNRQVSNQIVIHKEGIVDLEAAQLVQFATHLLQALNPRLATEHDDDVAELATKWAAARELQRDVAVALELQEVEARRRGVGEGHRPGLVVYWFGAAVLEVAAELLPDVFGFPG